MKAAQQGDGQTCRGPFAIMTILFFMWGFMTVFNDVLIPRFKSAFALNYFEAMLVQFAFFGAYFVGSLLYFVISARTGDPIARMGYKNGIVVGLLISAIGSAIFVPASLFSPYSLLLIRGDHGVESTQVASPMFNASDIKDLPSLATKLKNHADPISQLLWSQCSEEARTNLLAYSGAGSEAQTHFLENLLPEQLNNVIRADLIRTNDSLLAGISLSDETKALAAKTLSGHELIRFNRAVLEDAFPHEIFKAPGLLRARRVLELNSYPLFLLALFIVGLGFAMLQIAANPYVTILEPERTASSRLNLAQGFNSVGTIGPLIGGYLIFQYSPRPARMEPSRSGCPISRSVSFSWFSLRPSFSAACPMSVKARLNQARAP